MLALNNSNTKLWSRFGSRATFGLVALELGDQIDNLMILTSDVSTSAGLDRYKKKYPDKYIDVGIAEQNLIGIAAGLSSENYNVITTTFAPFQTMRCCEQIRVNVGYMKHNICMVGLASGVVLGTLGYTHCCIEDVSVMRSIPGITVISPADCGETVKAIFAAVQHPQPVYLRLTGGTNNPIVYSEDYTFEIGKAVIHGKGEDLTIIATGTMVHESIKAADLLNEKGISATVIDMHTIKPLDTAIIRDLFKTSRLIVTVEEHSVTGGLGSAVAEFLSTQIDSPPQLIIGLPNEFGKGGEYQELLEYHGLTFGGIATTIFDSYQTNFS